MNHHNQQTLHGISWNLLRVAVQAIFSIIVMAVLARLLPPEDFGLLALVLVFVGFAELLSSLGMGPAVIQKKEITRADMSAAQTLSMLMGLLLTLICLLIAEPMANFYADPRLSPLLMTVSFSLLLGASGAVARALILREMAFKTLFFIDLVAYVVGYPIIAVILALNDYGVWSLAWGHIALSGISTLLAVMVAKIPFSLHINLKKIMKLVHFGVGVSLSSTVNYVAANIDYLLIGRYLGNISLGLYSRAYHLITLPLIKISVTITTVLFSSMSAIQHDKKKVLSSFYQALEAMSLITFPILFVFFIASEQVIYGIYGDQWGQAIDVFRILSIAGLLKSAFHLSGTVLQATGHVFMELKLQIIYFIILLVGCLIAVHYSMEAVAWVSVIASLFLYLSKAHMALKVIEGRWYFYFKAQLPAVLLSLFVGAVDMIYITFNQYYFQLSHELTFILLILVSGLAFLLGFFVLPEKYMGDSTLWVKQKIRAYFLKISIKEHHEN